MTKTPPAPISESMQMYLVTIARLRVNGHPVPLSQLARALSISPVSVNEMCRKLQDQELVIYRPYKGAMLTPEGEQRAHYVLRRHRLWEVFLVEKLGLDYDQAHKIACQLEHSTPKLLGDRLDAFLGYPSVNPQGEPIPRANGVLPARSLLPLAALSAGQRGYVVRRDVSETVRAFLDEQGVRPGASLTMVAKAQDNLLVRLGETHISLTRTLAEAVQVEMERTPSEAVAVAPVRSDLDEEEQKDAATQNLPTRVALHELKVGQRGIIVRVRGQGPIRRRMMDMGLVTGAEVKVVRVAPLGDPVEFEVKGYSLSLRKSEARNVTVEVSSAEPM
ncbi:MAG: metal-dependent transcriptional regulator [Chloroflexota bacterium]|nr:metal-dependent transcriptional regulator [Chloroflexota bacterium]